MMLSINRILAIPYADIETEMVRCVFVSTPTWFGAMLPNTQD